MQINQTKIKETEAGSIPSDWKIVDLKSLTSVITKGTTPTTGGGHFTDTGINFVKVESITEDGNIVYNKLAHIDSKTNEDLGRSKFQLEDILYTIAGTIGRVAKVSQELLPANTNQAVAIIRADKNKIDIDYLKYYLNSSAIKEYKKSKIIQCAQPNLSLGDIGQMPIVIPRIDEQKSIVSVLNNLDKKIELNRRINQTLEAIGETIFKNEFIGLVMKGWKEASLDSVATFLNGLPLQKFPSESEDYLPVIKIRELKSGVTDSTDRASCNIDPKYIIEDGDILFSWSGSLEVVLWAGGKGALNQHLFKVTSESYPKWFYYYWLKYYLPMFKRIAAGKATTMGHIQRHHLTSSIVFVPDEKKMNELDNLLSPIVELVINNLTEIRRLSQIRDSLLPKLMSGKVRVR